MRSRSSHIAVAAALAAMLAVAGCSGGSARPPGPSSSGPPSPPSSSAVDTAGQGTSPVGPRELVLERCTRCHDLMRIMEAQYNEDGWRATIERMRAKGAELSDEEAAAMAPFLAAGGASGF